MSRPFRFGVINEAMTTRAAWTEQARQVEDLGYATFLIRDHFVPDFFGDQFAPVAALMAAADATTRLRIGTLVIDNDYRHPVVLAKEVATLDLLSDGRVELGIGAGWLRREYDLAGIDHDSAGVRIDRLEEGLTIIKGLLGQSEVRFAGKHFQIDGLEGYPKPVQRPHPPIMIGAGKRRMLTLAGREADIVGFLTTQVNTGTVVDDPRGRMTPAVQEQISWVREGAGERFEQIELSTVATIVLTDERRSRTERLIAEQEWNGISVEDVWDMPAVFVGSVDQIVDDMERRREELGISYFVVANARQEIAAPIVARLAGK
jgi:probable F420-dependent oxidoreductase